MRILIIFASLFLIVSCSPKGSENFRYKITLKEWGNSKTYYCETYSFSGDKIIMQKVQEAVGINQPINELVGRGYTEIEVARNK